MILSAALFAVFLAGNSQSPDRGIELRPFESTPMPLRSEFQVTGGGGGGARIRALAWSAGDPLRVLLGTGRNGLWFSRNGGASFSPAATLSLPEVQCVAFSPWSQDRAYCLASARDRAPFTASRKEGLWRSDDGGETWRFVVRIPLEEGVYGGSIAFSENGGTRSVLVGSHGRGICVTRDGGDSWNWRPVGVEGWVAGLFARKNVVLCATTEGVFRSENGGETFSPIPALKRSRFVTARGPIFAGGSDPGSRIYLASSEGVLYVSCDEGRTWRSAAKKHFFPDRYFLSVFVSPRDDEFVVSHLKRPREENSVSPLLSRDGGASWKPLEKIIPRGRFTGPVESFAEAVAFHPRSAGVLLAGIDRELMRSADGGFTWHACGSGFYGWRCGGTNFAARAPLNEKKLWLALGEAGLWVTANGGRWFRPVLRTGEECVGVACHPDPARSLLLSWWRRGRRLTLRVSNDGGRSWSSVLEGVGGRATFFFHPVKGAVIFAGGYVSEDGGKSFRSLGADLLAIAERTGEVLYGTDPARPLVVRRSEDGGKNWEKFGADLPAAALCGAVAAEGEETLYVGTKSGLVRSTPHGLWKRCGPEKEALSLGTVTGIHIDPRKATNLIATVKDPWLREGGILETADGGRTWRLEKRSAPLLGIVRLGLDRFLVAADTGLFRLKRIEAQRE